MWFSYHNLLKTGRFSHVHRIIIDPVDVSGVRIDGHVNKNGINRNGKHANLSGQQVPRIIRSIGIFV